MTDNIKKNKKNNFQSRPPVVVVLGHVDHGKSSILEAIKDFKITAKESGGITQHIGAYEIEHNSKKITFLDTPGHEAFSAMRSRGAGVADVAILVVAADEGVKPQTKEAITHIKKAGIPLIVAINKIDKSEADPFRIKRELNQNGVLVESMAGEVPSVEVSAKTKKGIPDLLEMILLVAEMGDLKTDTSQAAEGVVIEGYLDSQRGPTATVILRNGVLNLGDVIGTASVSGKIKGLENFQGNQLKEALPSMPVIILGLENVPQVGEKFKVFSTQEEAKNYIEKKEKKYAPGEVFVLEEGKKVLNLIIKADVLGSLEAIEAVLKDLPQEKVTLRILKAEVGEINETDVRLAKSSKAKILGFRVKASSIVVKLAERENLGILTFNIIYELAQGARQLMDRALGSELVRKDLGKVKVMAVFMSEKSRQIIGGKVIEGEVKKGSKLEIIRNNEKVGDGKIINLQRNKKDAQFVARGEECGMLYEGNAKVELGDVCVVFVEEWQKG